MLQQILSNMYVDPEILEALNEEQKKTLFLKMREEQVRRWKEREVKEEREGRTEKSRPKKATFKKVSWLLGRDGDVHVRVIGETDELKRSSKKFFLSEFRTKNENDLNNTNRPQTTGYLKSNLENQAIQQDSKSGIELLLKKADVINYSDALPDFQKHHNNHSIEELKSQKDDSSYLSAPRMDREPSVLARLNQFGLQKSSMIEDEQERGVVNDQGLGSPFGGRVAQLRMNFNMPNTKTPSRYTKPPVPSKPAHLLAAASVR